MFVSNGKRWKIEDNKKKKREIKNERFWTETQDLERTRSKWYLQKAKKKEQIFFYELKEEKKQRKNQKKKTQKKRFEMNKKKKDQNKKRIIDKRKEYYIHSSWKRGTAQGRSGGREPHGKFLFKNKRWDSVAREFRIGDASVLLNSLQHDQYVLQRLSLNCFSAGHSPVQVAFFMFLKKDFFHPTHTHMGNQQDGIELFFFSNLNVFFLLQLNTCAIAKKKFEKKTLFFGRPPEIWSKTKNKMWHFFYHCIWICIFVRCIFRKLIFRVLYWS